MEGGVNCNRHPTYFFYVVNVYLKNTCTYYNVKSMTITPIGSPPPPGCT